MAETTVQTNNQLIQFRREITKEYFRFNEFSGDMGNNPTAIIHRLFETRQGGDQINVPLVEQLSGAGKGTGTLVGNEEALEDYGCRVWIDTSRNAVQSNRRELQKESAKMFNYARPLLSNWGINKQRNDIIEALMALPSEAPPTGLQSDDGQTVNGIKYEVATAAQRNTWNAANSDRILYGRSLGNYNATHATALANIAAAQTLNGASVIKMKGLARRGSPKISPTRVNEGENREYYKMYVGSVLFNDLAEDLKATNLDGRPRNVGANPVFQDGDIIYRGVIIRELPEIDEFTENVWTTLATAGATGIPVRPAFLCGQSAIAQPWGMMPTPTTRKEDDYQHIKGVGIEMCLGAAKLFKKVPKAGTALKQWGVVTGFFAQSAQ